MNRILITAGTSALALKIKNILTTHFDVQLGESDEIPSVLEKNYIKIPQAISPSFAHQILKIALDNNIDKILPLKEAEVKKLNQSITLFEEYGITILVPTPVQLDTIKYLSTPNKSIKLSLIENNIDLFTGQPIYIDINGLIAVSDDQEDFALVVS